MTSDFKESPVTIMPISRNDQNHDFCIINAIHQSVLLTDLPTPSTLWPSFQRLRMTKSGLGMLFQFFYQLVGLPKSLGLTLGQFLQITKGLSLKANFKRHIPRGSRKRPSLLLAVSHNTRLARKQPQHALFLRSTAHGSSAWHHSSLSPVWPHILRVASSGSHYRLSDLCFAKAVYSCPAIVLLS